MQTKLKPGQVKIAHTNSGALLIIGHDANELYGEAEITRCFELDTALQLAQRHGVLVSIALPETARLKSMINSLLDVHATHGELVDGALRANIRKVRDAARAMIA